jgi:hypothetical protein
MRSHLLQSCINNLHLTTQIVGNITTQNMKNTMLCHTMYCCFFYGVPILTSNGLPFHIGFIIFRKYY